MVFFFSKLKKSTNASDHLPVCRAITYVMYNPQVVLCPTWVGTSHSKVYNQSAGHKRPGSWVCSQSTLHEHRQSGQANKLGQLLSPRNNRTWQAGTTWGRRWGEGWQVRDTDIKQELFLNTCWSFKTQWHFFTWANIFKVSFPAKFILNFTSQIYFLVWADWSDYLYSWPKSILCFHLALKNTFYTWLQQTAQWHLCVNSPFILKHFARKKMFPFNS